MADTLKFGPEWLRALSDGNSLGTPPPSTGFGKYKLADYRYGREEMLALFNPNCKVPEELEGQTYVAVEKAQEPLALIPLSEEEQRLLSQSVNSMAVLRMFGRGGPPGVRGGRGGGPERGRGRGIGRGRGEGGFVQRGTSYDDIAGGFGRPPRTDGWEEVGSKRNYPNRFDDPSASGMRREFTRSLSNSDNWRGKDDEEEGDGDWRKAGTSKWGARGNWRDPSNRERGGFDSHPNGVQRGGRSYQRGRNSESWEDEGENLPEWSMPDPDDLEQPGTFDSSGAFVFNKLKGMVGGGGKGDHQDNKDRRGAPGLKLHEAPKQRQRQDSKEDKSDSDSSNKNEEEETCKPVKDEDRPPPQRETVDKLKNRPVKANTQTPSQESDKPSVKEVSDSKRPSNLLTAATSDTKHSSQNRKTSNVSSNSTNSAKKEKGTPAATAGKTKSGKKSSSKKESQIEQEALDRLKEKAEYMVLGAIDLEAEEEDKNPQDDENSKKWFYLDPQGDVQGPFTSSEMAEWFSAGYFTMNLQVKRGCDDRYSPLGELIKRWGRVPFLPGSAPPPLLNSPQRTASPDLATQQQQDQMKLLQQQYVIQQHMMHQQMVLRHLQMQQLQQLMTALQGNEQFKNLPLLHQQQLATQILLKQSPMLPVPGVQPDPKLSPRSPPTERVGSDSPRDMSHTFHRSLSQPADLSKSQPQADDGSIWGSISPAVQDLLAQGTGSVWDLDPKSVISATDLEAQLEKARKDTDEMEKRAKEEEERQRLELLHRKQEELRLQQEDMQREKDEMEKQKAELERQRYLEVKKLEENRRREEEERQRREEEELQRRKVEEDRRQREEKIRRQKEEEMRRRREEETRQQEVQRQQEELRQRELQRQDLLRQQEIQRQQEVQRQEEDMEKQKQIEIQKRQEAQRQQELQQQDALRKLQQEQLAKIQLPSHAQWANQQTNAVGASGAASSKAQSLLDIQEQEEKEWREHESMQRKMEAQRQQMMAIQQQQQQQKSWSSQVLPSQSNGKSLLEIQEEQSRQETVVKTEQKQAQESQTKNLTLGAASVWGGVTSPSHWASEGAWGNAIRAQTNAQQNSGTSNGTGFWDDAIISSKHAPAASSKSSGQSNTSEFPALKGGSVTTPTVNISANKPKPSKMKKEEEAVHKLFQGNISKGDNFTQWCEKELKSMATSVDVPTFVSFLKEVDSPYEVHDYVRSYLGDNKASIDFAKQFLEKRSQNRSKSRQQQQQPEDSIWGPAPARDFRQSQPSSQPTEFESQKVKGKKKKKMLKIDSSILGFTVHADPARKNIGEIDNMNK